MNRDDIPLPIMFLDSEDQEVEHHISDLGRLVEEAYARFEAHGNPADRDAAIEFAHMRALAIKGRSAARVARMEADYFGERGAADRRAVEVRT